MNGISSGTSEKQCPSCGAMNIPNAIFCSHCGSKLEMDSPSASSNQAPVIRTKKCTYCGFENNEDFRYCYSCGNILSSTISSMGQYQFGTPFIQNYGMTTTKSKDHSDFRIFWFLFLGIVVLGALIAGVPGAITVGGAVFPAIIILYYFYRKDPNREPGKLVMKVFIFGVLSSIPAVIIELILLTIGLESNLNSSPIAWAFWQAFIVAAVTEEWLKFETTKLGVWKHPEFDEPIDGVTYAVAAALGFAAIENIVYAIGAEGSTIALLFMRGLLSVPLHAITGAFIGIGIAKWKLQAMKNPHAPFSRPQILAIPVLIHGSFNFGLFLYGDIRGFLVGVITLGISLYALRKNLRKLSESITLIIGEQRQTM